MQISIFVSYSLYILVSFLIIISSSKEQQQPNSNKTLKYDDISSIYNWAKKNGIYINPNMQLNKNSDNDLNHTFYYFTSNKKIKNNTLLLRIPYSILISPESLDKIYKKGNNKKLSNLLNKVMNIDQYLTYNSSKHLFYISVMLSHATFNQRGKLYKKYEEYLNMYNYINLDDYPIFFKGNEMAYLNFSNFGKEIQNNLKSINNEYYLIKHVLGMDETIIVEEFIKYRILSLTNSIYRKNKTYVVPFFDCFQKKVNWTIKEYDAYSIINQSKTNKNEFDVLIYTNKTIKKNKEISILWKQVSNTENYLYYGFIDENNMITPSYLVDTLNKQFLNDLNIDSVNKEYKINFEEVIEPKHYDLSFDFYDTYLFEIYQNLSQYFSKYYRTNEGPYVMMRDNLVYYLNLYKEIYTEELIRRNMDGTNKKRCVQNILAMERKLLENRITTLNEKIERVIRNKEERDIYELLKRADKYYKEKAANQNEYYNLD